MSNSRVLKYAQAMDNKGTVDMLVYKPIGGKNGISGAMFAEELTFLSQYLEPAPKEIKVRINSVGGGVLELFSMFSAIINANKHGRTVVNTYVDGIAASSAGLLAMAGKECFMKDFSRIMLHGISMVDADGNPVDISPEDKVFVDVLMDMIATAYTNRTGKSKDEIINLLSNGQDNWFSSLEAANEGFVKKENIENTGLTLKEPKETDLAELVNSASHIINSLTKKPLIMKSVIMSLNLQEGSSESVILNAVNNLKTQLTAQGNKLTTAENKVTTLEAENARLQTESQTNAKNAAKTLVESYINKGVFAPANETEKSNLINQAESNPEAFQAMASMIKVPANKIAGNTKGLGNSGDDGAEGEISETLKTAINGRSLRELEKKQPTLINKIKSESFGTYVNMFNEAYGTNKTAEELA